MSDYSVQCLYCNSNIKYQKIVGFFHCFNCRITYVVPDKIVTNFYIHFDHFLLKFFFKENLILRVNRRYGNRKVYLDYHEIFVIEGQSAFDFISKTLPEMEAKLEKLFTFY